MPIPRFIPRHPVPDVCGEMCIPALRRGAGRSGARGDPTLQVTFTGRLPYRIPLPGSRAVEALPLGTSSLNHPGHSSSSPSHRNWRPPLLKGGEVPSSRIQETNEEPPMRIHDRSPPK